MNHKIAKALYDMKMTESIESPRLQDL